MMLGKRAAALERGSLRHRASENSATARRWPRTSRLKTRGHVKAAGHEHLTVMKHGTGRVDCQTVGTRRRIE